MPQADSGYAYSKVYGALERRGVAALIPAKKEPSQSRVPLRLFRYDARNNIVKCPRGKTLGPRRDTERGRYYGSKTWHGLARAVRRGLDNMKIQSYLMAAAINLKRLAAALAASLFALWTASVARKRSPRAHRAHPRQEWASCPPPRESPYRPLPKPGYSTTPSRRECFAEIHPDCGSSPPLEFHSEIDAPGVFIIVRAQAARREFSAQGERALAISAAQAQENAGFGRFGCEFLARNNGGRTAVAERLFHIQQDAQGERAALPGARGLRDQSEAALNRRESSSEMREFTTSVNTAFKNPAPIIHARGVSFIFSPSATRMPASIPTE